MNGGEILARTLSRHGVRFLFTLCGGHISPLLVGAKARGIRVVDVRHEATAVFAADAVARLAGVPGVAAVTAGPGVTNSITALKNAQLAQSPVVLLGGAAATVLKGRGSLQDIDQKALAEPHVKAVLLARRVRDLAPALEEAFAVASTGVPGPVFVDCPVDLLYPEEQVRGWYKVKTEARPRNLAEAAQRWYLRRHLDRLFAATAEPAGAPVARPSPPEPDPAAVRRAADLLAQARRPVLVVGSQALAQPEGARPLAGAVERLGMPTYLGGMARGLLGRGHPLQLRHQRRAALKEADLVILAGFPCDFRLDYGGPIRRGTTLIAANRSRRDLTLNRRPSLGFLADAGLFLRRLAAEVPEEIAAKGTPRWREWLGALRSRDAEREGEIARGAEAAADAVNPLALCREIERALPEASVLVADGGDFVATASYIVSPRGPLSWLDPGAFGTLGVGAGFALGAKLCRPEAEVWLLWGDGAAGLSLCEVDTFARHGLPILAVVGNDAGWTQIAREQVPMLGDDVGTVLARCAYHRVAEGLGGVGFELKEGTSIASTLAAAREAAAGGHPVLINAHLAPTEFRKGSLAM
jgi:acetolactate synthase-1/2/3 large subunit